MDKSFDLGKLLKNHENKHKGKPKQFSCVASGIKKRLETNLKQRKSSRLSIFDRLRSIETTESPVKVSKAKQKEENRRQQLEKWKQEREKQKKEAAAQKKKPFVAGVAHYTLRSIAPPPVKPSTSGYITRSKTAKNSKSNEEKKVQENCKSFAPKNAKFQAPSNLNQFPKLQSIRPRRVKNANIAFAPVKINSVKNTSDNKKQSKKEELIPLSNSNALNLPKLNISDNNKTPKKMKKNTKDSTKKNTLPKSESKSEEKLRSPKSLTPKTPEQTYDSVKISPFVTLSRGKENARREMKQKLEEGLLDDDASDIDNIIHFRQQLASETDRITGMCDTWNKIKECTQLPEFVQEAVLAAVGQARLLMSQKMMQFASLVERCARPDSAHALVTPADLHGFWDMLFMQIENVNIRFKKLDELKDRGWVEEQKMEVPPKIAKPVVKKMTKPTAGQSGPSRLREMIAAARKAKKEQGVQTTNPELGEDASKNFEAGFFRIETPIKKSSTPTNRVSMLKSVLSSEAKKAVSASKHNASFAMLRASVFGKNIEDEGVAPLPQTPPRHVDIQATPGRSILKSAKSDKKSSNKSNKVLFRESDGETKDNSTLLDCGESVHEEENEPKVTHIKAELRANITEIENNGFEQENVIPEMASSRRSSKSRRQDVECKVRSVVTRSMRRSMHNQSLLDAD